MDLEFVPVTESSIDSVLEMAERLYALWGDRYDAERTRPAMLRLIAEPQHGGMWLMKTSGQVAGYMVVTVCFSLEFGGLFGLLDELYLQENARGSGMGWRAIEFAESFCRERGLHALRLEVGHANARAIALYKRTGFRAEDRHLMTRWL